MVYLTNELMNKYSDYSDSKGKIRREVEDGKLFPIMRGLYEDNSHVNPAFLASWICSPSYLSFDYVLSLYSMIPEAVYSYTSASFNKGKKKEYKTRFGLYIYQDIPKLAYYHGVSVKIEEDYSYQIASCEKALCDKLYSISPVKNEKDFNSLLFEDLRIYEDEFWALDMDALLFLSPFYHSTNLDFLSKLIRKRRSR